MALDLDRPRQFGRYFLQERIAVGGMAEIYRAKASGAHGFEKTVVVKRILPQLVAESGGGFIERFIAEARLMMRLNHPKVVQVLDFGEVDGQHFIAMEYVKGIDGSALLRTCARVRRRPTTGVAVHMAAEILDALDFAHNLVDRHGKTLGITHRDVSPSNIFISEMGQVKLGDFGIAKVDAWKEHTEPGALKGKYGYLSPEAVTGQPVDHRADLFSAGVVLAELLMIRRLFIADNPLDVLLQVRDVNLTRMERYGTHIDNRLREIIEAALARDPGLRFQDAATFRDALHRYLFEQQLMVRDSEVRRFLHDLREAEAGLLPDERSEADPIDANERERVDEVATASLHQEHPLAADDSPEQGNRQSRHRASYRRRRKMTIQPPPKPKPVPADAVKDARLRSSDALAAVAEIAVDLVSPTGFRFEPIEEPPETARPQHRGIIRTAEEVAQANIESMPLPRPSFDGTLGLSSAVEVFFRLASEEQQGLLVFRSDNVVKEIYYEDGDPEYVASNLPEELFGQYLLRHRALTQTELSMALGELERFNGKLGAALVGLRLLKPMEVMRHLTDQVRHKLLDVFSWRRGEFAFYGGLVFSKDAAPLGLEGYEIIGAGVNSIPGPTLRAHLGIMMDGHPRSVCPPAVPPEVFRLGGYTRKVYETLDGGLTLGQWLERFEDERSREMFARTVYLLVETGLATV